MLYGGNMEFDSIRLYNNENIKKIKLETYNWDELIKNKEILYEAICKLLFDKNNLFYYATQRESTKTVSETKQYIKKLIEKNIIDSEVETIFKTIGWDSKNLNINSTTFQGDLAEYLMNILIDKITNIETLISKVSLKTSPQMPSYGNDNIYYDYDNEILYYGESKFYSDVESAIKKAKESLLKHSSSLEFSFIKNHTNSIIANNGVKRTKVIEELETKSLEDVIIKSIFFIANDDIYLKSDYEQKILNSFGNIETIKAKSLEMIMIFFPVLSKEGFLKYFSKRLEENE